MMRRVIGASILAAAALAYSCNSNVLAAALAYIPDGGVPGRISVIDTATSTISGLAIPVDAVPGGIAITSDGTRAYVTNLSISQGFGNGTVSVISTTTRATLATLTVGGEPRGVAVTPDGRTAYVANADDGTVSVIDASTLAVTSAISVGVQPEGVVVSPDGMFLYVSTYKNVYVVSTSSNAVLRTIGIGDYANGIAISRDGKRLYVANINSNLVKALDRTLLRKRHRWWSSITRRSIIISSRRRPMKSPVSTHRSIRAGHAPDNRFSRGRRVDPTETRIRCAATTVYRLPVWIRISTRPASRNARPWRIASAMSGRRKQTTCSRSACRMQ
jgi:YVTN family beta-propeller protein